MKLPREIASACETAIGDHEPKLAARALADIDGNLGETYLVTDGTTLLLFSTRLGEQRQDIQLPLSDCSAIEIDDDRPFFFLVVTAPDREYRLKFGGMERDELQQLIELWRDKRGGEPAAEPPAEEDQAPASLAEINAEQDDAEPPPPAEFQPFVGFCAALQSMMEVDGSIDDEERHILQRVVGRSDIVTRAIDYRRRHSLDDLIESLAEALSHRQKYCLIANLAELAMADGELRGSEQELLKRYMTELEVTEENTDAIFEVLELKNNLSVFST